MNPRPPRCLLSAIGLIASLTAAATDSPLVVTAPLAEAKAVVAAIKARGPLPPGGVVVEILAGTHRISGTITLTEADGGTTDSPIVWRAAPGGRVTLSGGTPLTDWRAVDDPAVRARLSEASRPHVVVADLRAVGITDFGTIEQRGSPGIELFYEGRRMPLARFPNNGWLLVAGVPQTGPKRLHEGLAREERVPGVPVGRHYGRISYAGDQPAAWAPDDAIFLHGYWVFDWSDSFQRVQSIDTALREITLADPHHNYGYAQGQRFRFLNVLEELDEPGEWYLDRNAGRIYFHPPAAIAPGATVVSVLSTPLVVLDGVTHFSLEGFTLEHGRAGGVVIKGGERCQIAGTTFRELGGEALVIDGGREHRIVSCNFHDLATGAIRVTGGDRATLTPSGHEILNNHIHHFSQWLRTGQYGIFIDGVGQRIAHNLIHDAPFEAMYQRGNDHVIEFNEVYRVCTETGDAGAIHTGRDYTWRGNIIRYNYWHDLKGPGLHGVTAVYLDDFSSGYVVHGNVFHRAGRAVQIGGGRDNTISNNLFIDCSPSVHHDARGLSWAAYYFNGVYPWLFERFAEVRGGEPPYSDRYPELKSLLQDEPPVPKGNLVRANISWGSGRWSDVYDFHAFDFGACVAMRDNFVANSGFMRRRASGLDGPDPYYLNIDGQEGYVLLPTDNDETRREFAGNELSARALGTFDPKTLRLTLDDPALMERIGFEPLPLEKMGLQRDAWRTTLPARE